ncbi:hypothetical protein Ari01nite_12210 [Paractinoplanes rishiriensis]|uniref:PKD domain-containing protein n=2 Tax=Paractinoplanes rishiriensis TaxID=1050105 RepID=A0A919MN85_9ACTN|nr:hypothetical protein Ari01nite_12210 [Actinoplanes rishiriensis]
MAFGLGVAFAIAGPLAGVAIAVPVTPATPRTGRLVEVGPIAENGFPAWYRDSNGLRLEACVTVEDPLCPAAADELPDPDAPVSWPDNFPGEFFYQLAGAELTMTNGVDAGIGLDLEGAFAGEVAAEGDQIVFGRVRIRFDANQGERYRITHPYGIDDIVADDRGVNMTEDIGIAAGNFGLAMNSRVGPFLRWDPAVAPAAPAGYTGDPGVEHRIVGSPYGTNFIRIERLNPTTGAVLAQMGFTDLFSVQGRLAVNSGVDLSQATYSLNPDGTGSLDVFATSEAGQSIDVVGNTTLGYRSTRLRSSGARYYGRFPITGPMPNGTMIEVVNTGDNPVARKTRSATDMVWVEEVRYDSDARTLLVRARSSDRLTNPALTVTGFGALTSTAFTGVTAPPPTVTVTSAKGGSTTVPLVGAGGTFAPAAPVAVAASPDAGPIVGQTVRLDGSGSTGEIDTFTWTQTGGPAVTLTNANQANATFVPSVTGTYTFRLAVSGPGGAATPVTVSVTVVGAALPGANAGPDQSAIRGRVVNLNGSATTGAETYSWRQVSGPLVSITGATTSRPSFTFPVHALPAAPGPNAGFVYNNEAVTLELTTTNPAGTTTDRVVITPQPDAFAGMAVRYRTGNNEWRISGNTTLVAGQRVTAVVGNALTGRVIGTANTDAAGAFSIRVTGPQPAGATTISLISTTGARTLAFPVNVTN